jgi:hypothetical protein
MRLLPARSWKDRVRWMALMGFNLGAIMGSALAGGLMAILETTLRLLPPKED